MSRSRPKISFLAPLAATLLALQPAGAVTLTEINYHPPVGSESLEFIEVSNDLMTPEDLSGWAFVEGISFVFPPKTILGPRAILVVCADAVAVKAKYGISNAVGNYSGKLDGSGERVTLVNHAGVVIQSLKYQDSGRWPAGPDGTGHTLSLRSLHLDPSESESWAQSAELGGTPGKVNFPTGPPAPPPLRFNELLRGAAGSGGWVELFNAGRTDAILAGYTLTDDPARPIPYSLPAGATVPGGGFLRLDEAATGLILSAPRVQLFLLDPRGVCAAALTFDRPAPPGWSAESYGECRFPDGGDPGWVTRTPTPLAPNQVERVTDIVLNEIFYHPPEERLGSFVELYNRGAGRIELSGFRFDKGIDFQIPANTFIESGGYLVVAESPELMKDRYGLEGTLGPWTGNLSHKGEAIRLLDQAGNLVNEVHYLQGGSWSLWADGRGSSLELIDPYQDNSLGAAWDASDESKKAPWENLTLSVTRAAVGTESELWIYFLERGVCRLDDISLSRAGGPNLIPNPDFELGGVDLWSFLGTHQTSRLITDDAHSGAACLELEATTKGDTLFNRIEIDTVPRMTAGAYDLSLWARWQRGGSLLVVQTPYTPGSYSFHPSPATNMSGNTLAKGFRLTVPFNLGTPGAENSARRLLRADTGSDNLGPLIDQVRNRPFSPSSSQAVTITALVKDSDGVASAKVFYRPGSAAGAFTAVDLRDDGLGGDATAGDGIFSGKLPAAAGGAKIVYYLEATDTRGAARRFPLDAPERTCLYQVSGAAGGGLDSARIILDAQRTDELAARPLFDNSLLDGAFVINDEEVYYNVGVRYRASPWGRPGRANYRVRFQDDRPFYHGQRAINLDNSGAYPQEGAAYFLHSRNSTRTVSVPTVEYHWARTWLNGANLGVHALLQPVDRTFTADWYGSADTAHVFKVEGRRVLDDGGNLLGWDGMTFAYRGEETENYRGYIIPSIRQSVDEWGGIFALTKVMDARFTSAVALDQQIDSVMNVEQFLRCLAPRILVSDWDAFCIGNGHNGYLAQDPRDNRWTLFPFDMDNSFGNPVPNLFPNFDPSIFRLMSRPGPKRTYFRILNDFVNGGYWSATVAGPWLDAVQTATGVGFSGLKPYLTQSGNAVKTAIRASLAVPFRITTNGGSNLITQAESIDLEGDAPVTIAEIAFSVNDGDPKPLAPAWSTPTHWKGRFPLEAGDNGILFLGFNTAGDLLAAAGITVSRGAPTGAPQVADWSPHSGSETGGTEVLFTGTGFRDGAQVLFGGVPATAVSASGGAQLRAVAPPAPIPLPVGGSVDLQLVFSLTSHLNFPKAFTYTKARPFLRGDVNGDLQINLGDAIAALFYLFEGQAIPCAKAADFDDSGQVAENDAVALLGYLFRGGLPPSPPYPSAGTDPTADALPCP